MSRRRRSGLTGLRDPTPGFLSRTEDDGTVRLFRIDSAEFNIYEQDGRRWLTLFVRSVPESAATDGTEQASPELEANLVLDDHHGEVGAGSVLAIRSYDEELYNLASMYYWTHSPFDGEARIRDVTEESLDADVIGESDDAPVALRASFLLNRQRRRSFS